ncbi:MAG: hypothetical protein HQK51_11870 [Oligoflexia bacterium]|nr:hypothetical protein [Oligoflexia bacterium]
MIYNVQIPDMGKNIKDVIISKWCKNVGEHISFDDTLLEVSTDKIVSEIPSEVNGTITKIFFEEGNIVTVGTIIATIATMDPADIAIKGES